MTRSPQRGLVKCQPETFKSLRDRKIVTSLIDMRMRGLIHPYNRNKIYTVSYQEVSVAVLLLVIGQPLDKYS